ncbi:hypothetical protein CEE37_01930 [candidate division LCP-89 bacterium B3_LCP]|uniref:Addiction module toxin RelE n=1 Tax=candidate division LCP-89 bacterium B3_LCP TaxID=2012998 RepID=A0A532V5I2_UNCL8|nr:MAG: hypothetical protein CEE37_01930 [candidate division LCP-89 bacterium B3_LCP]
MEIINLQALERYIKKHRTAEEVIKNWVVFVENADWDRPYDVKQDYDARFISSKRVIFKLGNSWRIDTRIAYNSRKIYVIRIGTHEEYNKWKYKD